MKYLSKSISAHLSGARTFLLSFFVFAVVIAFSGTAAPARAQSVACSTVFTQSLSYGVRSGQVLALQQFLVSKGLLDEENTSGYFGPLTLGAVQTLQVQNGITTAGGSGYGLVGPLTRAYLNNACGNPVAIAPNPGTGVSSAGPQSGSSAKANLYATPTGNGSFNVSWTSTGTTSCTSNDFYIPSSGVSTSGATVVNISAPTTYSIVCVSAAGPVEAHTTMDPNTAIAINPPSGSGSGVALSCQPGWKFNPITGQACPTSDGTNPPVDTTTDDTMYPAVPGGRWKVGDIVVVAGGRIGGGIVPAGSEKILNVRSAPTVSGALLGSHNMGDKGRVIGGLFIRDGYQWWNIDFNTGVDGWSQEGFLESATATSPTVTASLSPSPATRGQTITVTGTGFDSNSRIVSYAQYFTASINPGIRPTSVSPSGTSLTFVVPDYWNLGGENLKVSNGASGSYQYSNTVGSPFVMQTPDEKQYPPAFYKFKPGDRIIVVRNADMFVDDGVGSKVGQRVLGDKGVIVSYPGWRSWGSDDPHWWVLFDDGPAGLMYERDIALDTNAAITKFKIGDKVGVVGTSVNTRTTGSTSGSVIWVHSAPDKGVIIGGPTIANGYTWWNVDFTANGDGWVVQDYLAIDNGSVSNPVVNPNTDVVNLFWLGRGSAGSTVYVDNDADDSIAIKESDSPGISNGLGWYLGGSFADPAATCSGTATFTPRSEFGGGTEKRNFLVKGSSVAMSTITDWGQPFAPYTTTYSITCTDTKGQTRSDTITANVAKGVYTTAPRDNTGYSVVVRADNQTGSFLAPVDKRDYTLTWSFTPSNWKPTCAASIEGQSNNYGEFAGNKSASMGASGVAVRPDGDYTSYVVSCDDGTHDAQGRVTIVRPNIRLSVGWLSSALDPNNLVINGDVVTSTVSSGSAVTLAWTTASVFNGHISPSPYTSCVGSGAMGADASIWNISLGSAGQGSVVVHPTQTTTYTITCTTPGSVYQANPSNGESATAIRQIIVQ